MNVHSVLRTGAVVIGVLTVSGAEGAGECASETQRTLLYEAHEHRNSGRFAEAEQRFHLVVRCQELAGESDARMLSSTWVYLAELNGLRGRKRDALTLLWRAREMLEANDLASSPEMADTLLGTAAVYKEMSGLMRPNPWYGVPSMCTARFMAKVLPK
jgi:hypothetical protein